MSDLNKRDVSFFYNRRENQKMEFRKDSKLVHKLFVVKLLIMWLMISVLIIVVVLAQKIINIFINGIQNESGLFLMGVL